MLNHLLECCPNLSLSEHFLRVFFQTELSLISDATCSCTERSVNVRYITHQIYTVLLILLPICEWAFCVKFSLNWTLFFFFRLTGTTWMSYILDLLYFRQDKERENSQPIFDRVPFLELAIPCYATGLVALHPDATTLEFTIWILTPLWQKC